VNVGPDDRITIDGEALPSRERTRLWLFHKPRGLVTTFRDPEGRPTVFEALPEDMPRVVAIGRLDINTEGLLLLTNDGGLAKVIAHPETGWTRRYRVRAHGEVTQAELDKLRKGITVDGMEYGPIEATLDRVQGDNMWLTLALREGKNREVKRVLEHLGIQVNRLIRLSFGPFQLGDLEQGLVEEVRTRVLKDQLGAALAAEANVDFESPVREPIAPFGRPEKEVGQRPGRDRPPRARSAGDEDRFGARERRPSRDIRPDRPERAAAGKPRETRKTVWRADAPEEDEAPRRSHARREDPKADRAASAARTRERVGAIASPEGRRVLVERLVAATPDARSGDGDRPRRPRRDGADRPQRPVRGDRPERGARTGDRERPGGPKRAGGPGREREERRGPPRSRAPAGAPGAGRPPRGGPEGRSGGFPSRGGPRPGGRPGGKPGARPSGGPGGRPAGRPGGGPKGRPR
jgi:23S rRNA pseudouridine2605 synthase